MSEMVDRVARAIARGRHGLGDTPLENALAIDYHWQKYALDARTAIAAMRDIPPEAIDGAWGFGVSDWNAVIDRLLSPAPHLRNRE